MVCLSDFAPTTIAFSRLQGDFFYSVHVIAGKPNSKYDSEDGDEDPHFKKIIERANQEPTKKFPFPQTEAQEIGWVTRPLVSDFIQNLKPKTMKVSMQYNFNLTIRHM